MTKEERSIVGQYIRTHVDNTHHQIADELGLSYSTICRIAQEFGVHRKTGPKPVLQALLSGKQEQK